MVRCGWLPMVLFLVVLVLFVVLDCIAREQFLKNSETLICIFFLFLLFIFLLQMVFFRLLFVRVQHEIAHLRVVDYYRVPQQALVHHSLATDWPILVLLLMNVTCCVVMWYLGLEFYDGCLILYTWLL